MKQVNKNFIYNIIYQIFIYLIPLISVPYISRTLGVNNVGIYSYTYSMVYYFMLAAMLGINNYGSRTIAKCKDDIKNRTYTFWSIYLLQAILSITMLILFVGCIFVFNSEYKIILLIQSIYLLSVFFDINWFFFGMEQFKLTISRNIIIKLLSLILIFVFVKNEGDLWKYTLIMSSSTLISQMYLWIYLKKYIGFVKVKIKDVFSHFSKCFILFIPVIAYSIYRVMDKTMIGSFSGTIELGYYENAEKIIAIPVSLITAFGTVMMPYMSKNFDEQKDVFNQRIFKSFQLYFCFVIPMLFGLIAVGDNFSIIFFGDDFAKSGKIIQFLAISILFSSIANVIRTNYLIPKEKDKIYVCSTIFGAIINLILNLIFIPKFGAYGACIGTVAAEFSVMFYQLIKVRKEIDIVKMFKLLTSYIFKGFIMLLTIIFIPELINNKVISLIIQFVVAIIVYFLLNYKYILFDFLGLKMKTINKI